MAAHLFGGRVELEPILALTRPRGIMVIEDAAQAFRGPRNLGHPGGRGQSCEEFRSVIPKLVQHAEENRTARVVAQQLEPESAEPVTVGVQSNDAPGWTELPGVVPGQHGDQEEAASEPLQKAFASEPTRTSPSQPGYPPLQAIPSSRSCEPRYPLRNSRISPL
ncbi:MAG: DegT/DnrJ/EryC1/StrS family aminotransferase [Candidatus Wallbacteria bacterium]|nr:DegT/DnrJ/EryC1/StrS family aminotransferase [Candidatus Wallbacteria bacterium]